MIFTAPPCVLVQGITGRHGSLHTAAMLEYGTDIKAGTSPNTDVSEVSGVPVFTTVAGALQTFADIDTSVVFVPAAHCKAAVLEAIEAGISNIICITEGIPLHDMLEIKRTAEASGVSLLGPNCPGLAVPHLRTKLGIIPASVLTPGSVALVSTSGTLTYEVAASMSVRGIGQRVVVGIGGDPIRGTGFVRCLESFSQDPAINSIVMIGEIGGHAEYEAAEYIETHRDELPPIFGYITGRAAPEGIQLGHAGAILKQASEGAVAKSDRLDKAGVYTGSSLPELIEKLLHTNKSDV